MRKRKNEKITPPIHPNVGITVSYRKSLHRLIDQMNRSYGYWLAAQFRETPPRMAQDATPAKELERELGRLGRSWKRKYDEAAPKLARYFAQATWRRTNANLRRILKDSGIAVEFQMTPRARDVFEATVAENVGLIKSIAEQYHGQVQTLVMQSVSSGRDLGYLSKQLRKRYGITKRRAALIARDQNNKATATITRVRQQEVGGDDAVAIWIHSHGGKEPRPTHLKNDGKRYKVAQGWFDPDPRVKRFIWPGELINCRCVCRLVVKGFS